MAIHIITDLPTFRITAEITKNAVDIEVMYRIDGNWQHVGGIALNNKELETIYNLRK